MKSISGVGLCLVAVFTIAAAAASSASASEPAWYECTKAGKSGTTYLGDYAVKTCEAASKVATGGRYELKEGIGKGKKF
jgi:hypothetical protein